MLMYVHPDKYTISRNRLSHSIQSHDILTPHSHVIYYSPTFPSSEAEVVRSRSTYRISAGDQWRPKRRPMQELHKIDLCEWLRWNILELKFKHEIYCAKYCNIDRKQHFTSALVNIPSISSCVCSSSSFFCLRGFFISGLWWKT